MLRHQPLVLGGPAGHRRLVASQAAQEVVRDTRGWNKGRGTRSQMPPRKCSFRDVRSSVPRRSCGTQGETRVPLEGVGHFNLERLRVAWALGRALRCSAPSRTSPLLAMGHGRLLPRFLHPADPPIAACCGAEPGVGSWGQASP